MGRVSVVRGFDWPSREMRKLVMLLAVFLSETVTYLSSGTTPPIVFLRLPMLKVR